MEETSTTVPPADVGQQGSSVNEDWVAVWIGAAIITLVVAGVRFDAALFSWRDGADLAATVFAAGNVWRWLQLGVLILIPAAIGAQVMGARLGPFVAGFCGAVWAGVVLADPGEICRINRHRAGVRDLRARYRIAARAHDARSARWFAEAVQAEYYIKVGLVVLGTRVLFQQLVDAGSAGTWPGAVSRSERLDVLLLVGQAAAGGRRAGGDHVVSRVDLRRVGCDCHVRRDPGGSKKSCRTSRHWCLLWPCR